VVTRLLFAFCECFLVRPQIFACNHLMAFGVLQAARELNLRCPEDLSIAGFDSLEFTKFTEPSLTSVYQPGYQLGVTTGRLLLQRVAGTPVPKKVNLPTELEKRDSVGPRPMTPVRMAPHDLQLRAYATAANSTGLAIAFSQLLFRLTTVKCQRNFFLMRLKAFI
jgi:ABC-type sugar transport system substrate-binding protein